MIVSSLAMQAMKLLQEGSMRQGKEGEKLNDPPAQEMALGGCESVKQLGGMCWNSGGSCNCTAEAI